MSKKTKIILAVIFSIIVVGGAIVYFSLQNSGTAVDVAKVQSSSLAVTVMGSGKVTAIDKTDVYAETQGLIDEVYIADGDRVEQGQDLIKLDADALQAQLAQAKAAVTQAQAGLDQANFAATSKSNSISSAKKAVASSKKALDIAKKSKNDAQTLFNDAEKALDSAAANQQLNPQGYATAQAQHQQAKGALNQANAAVVQAEAALAQANSTLTQTKSSPTSGAIKAAKDGVAAAKQGVALANKAIENAVIAAPVEGTVIIAPSAASMAGGAAASGSGATAPKLSKGQAVAPGAPILSIVNTSTLGFTAEIDETNISRVSLGQKVALSLDAFPGQTITGVVKKINTSAQPTLTGGNIFQVEITINATESLELRLGMKGDATIEVEKVPNALSLPIEAIFSEGGSEYVYVVDADNKLVKTDIVTGTTTTQTSTEILEGVKEGDTVALAGSVAFTDGMRVTVTDSKK